MATTFLTPQNNAESKLNGAVNNAVTTWTVLDGGAFPGTYPFHVTCEDEIVSVTAKAGNDLTVTRAQESTSASAHATNCPVELLPTAKAISDLNTAVNTLENGAVMKSLFDAQTILRATSDNTPAALTVEEQRLVGRITDGNIAALTPAQVRTLLDKMHPDIGASDWGELSEFHTDNWEDLDVNGGVSNCANRKMGLYVPLSSNADTAKRRSLWMPDMDFDKDQEWIWLIWLVSIGSNVNAAFCAGCNGGSITGKNTIGFKIKDTQALYAHWVEEDNTAHEADLSLAVSTNTLYAMKVVYTAGSKLEWFVDGVSKASTAADLPSGQYQSYLINQMTTPAALHVLSQIYVGKIGYDLAF